MGLIHLFKLEKLKISSFTTSKRLGLDVDPFTVMYNPDTFSTSHKNVFQKLQGINTNGRRAIYSYSKSDELSIDLIIDGTGVGDYGLTQLTSFATKSVAEQIEKFLAKCFYMDGDLHEPRYLRIQWGEGPLKTFDCRLTSVDISYEAFERSGAPLRATLKCSFVEDVDPDKRVALAGKNSPDLSHARVVKSGDTLPLLCKEIYGSGEHYLRIAEVNQLDDFRNLTPGQELIFPPLDIAK